jgi:hypothetical protein
MPYQNPFENAENRKKWAFSLGEHGFENYRWMFEDYPAEAGAFANGFRKYEREGPPSEWGL